MKRAVIYARYSTDNQKDGSIEDQVRQARITAERHGYEVVRTYEDRALSGTGLLTRPAAMELLQDAKKRQFDAVIIEGMSRVSRDMEHTAHIFKQLNHYKIKIITQGGEITDIHAGLEGIVNSQFVKNLVVSVKRSMKARAGDGLIMGKINYGHRGMIESLPNGLTRFKPGVREVDPERAPIVIRIFEEYAAGNSPRTICEGLMRDGVPAPGGAKAWNYHKLLTSFIANPIYIGKLVWGTRENVKNPDTEKVGQRRTDEQDHIKADVPHLRIVPQELWDRAQRVRLGRSEAKFGKGKRSYSFKSAEKYLLVGMLRCGACGGNMMIGNSNMDGSPRVVCGNAHKRVGCEHRKSYSLVGLEEMVLTGVKEKLTNPKAVIEYTKAYHARWAEQHREIKADKADIQNSLNAVEVKIDRFEYAVGETENNAMIKSIMGKLEKLYVEREGLQQRLKAIEAQGASLDLHPTTVEQFCTAMTTLHGALQSDLSPSEIAPFRATFKNVFESFTVVPTEKRQAYIVKPFIRLSAITGIEVFNRISQPSVNRWEPNSVMEAPENNVISLGSWRAAA